MIGYGHVFFLLRRGRRLNCRYSYGIHLYQGLINRKSTSINIRHYTDRYRYKINLHVLDLSNK